MDNTLKIQFSGNAFDKSLKKKNKATNEFDNQEDVDFLNERSGFICQQIESSIKKSLPPGVRVSVDISFTPGSIEWVGEIYILDWASRLAGTIGLIDYIIKISQFSINKVMRKHLPKDFDSPVTEAVLQLKGKSAQTSTVNNLPRNIDWTLILIGLNFFTTILILCLLFFKL